MDTNSSEKIYQDTFDGIVLYYRDTTLTEELISKYKAGQIIMERGFVDMTFKFGGIAGNLRYVIASKHGNDLSKLSPDAAQYGHVVLSNNSYFKVLDVVRKNNKTQILLLEILPDSIEYFTKNTPDFENILITNTRENFEMNSHLQVLPELNTLDWRERTEFPLGMDGEGVFFAVDGLQDQQPR